MAMHSKTANDLIERRRSDGKVETIPRWWLEGENLQPDFVRRFKIITPAEAERRIAAGWRHVEGDGWHSPAKILRLEEAEINAWLDAEDGLA